jgi:ribosomal protein S18 acetylase RimI-like enzyme
MMQRSLRLPIFRYLLLLSAIPQRPAVDAFQLPAFGLGAVLFPVRKTIEGVSEYGWSDKYDVLREASDFFVDAFWTGKVGGGATKLTDRQRSQLLQSQLAEFNSRYGQSKSVAQRELLVCRNTQQEIIACAGVEVEGIPRSSLRGSRSENRAPLMSNLAVSSRYRRRGLAEALVQAVEELCVEWGHDSCFLYVERRNPAAVKLYQKLGYTIVWEDNSATTLLPTSTGELRNTPTVIVCMRKENLRRSRRRQASSWNLLPGK